MSAKTRTYRAIRVSLNVVRNVIAFSVVINDESLRENGSTMEAQAARSEPGEVHVFSGMGVENTG